MVVVFCGSESQNHFWMSGKHAKHPPSFHHSLPFPQPPSAPPKTNSIGSFSDLPKMPSAFTFRRASGDLRRFNCLTFGLKVMYTPETLTAGTPKIGWFGSDVFPFPGRFTFFMVKFRRSFSGGTSDQGVAVPP